ncbi:hypothetical protein MRX96_037936 [Rhipicephalus microplus]
MGELTQRLVSISDARDSGEPTPADPPQADYGADWRTKLQASASVGCVSDLLQWPPARQYARPDYNQVSLLSVKHCRCFYSAGVPATEDKLDTKYCVPVQATPDAPAKGQDTLDTAEDQTILDLFEDGLNPRTDARRYTVSDELCAIYERIESRWAEVCKTIRADLNRSNPASLHVTSCAKICPMSRRELIAEMKEVFRSSCEEFDKWRVWYLGARTPAVFQRKCKDGDRLSVMAAVLRYEILEGLPELEKCTRERAAALWKELVEEQWIDVDALFDS